MYTCETVVAPFKKAGYEILFYDFDRNMTPKFDENVLNKVSVISICGYYGFCNYDRNFVKKCKEHGIYVIEDTTHSILSLNGIDPNCDYIVGSLRKWMGVASGGFAIKVNGKFSLETKAPHEEHLRLRYESITKNDSDLFWKAEMLLREIFDYYAGDEQSEYIMTHADYTEISEKRRKNYQYILDHFQENNFISLPFPHLDDQSVPSHFTVFVDDREHFQNYMQSKGIKTSVFWVQGPYIDLQGKDDTKYIYEHVVSLPCDQRYNPEDMQFICDALNSYK